ncbi:MAG: RES family NAD+ phosphorylase [Hyphomonas sp.]
MRGPDAGSLDKPNFETLQGGSILHRIHSSAFAGSSFNPCQGQPSRFAPITDLQGDCIPSLYAGGSVECAIFETIFHDVPVTPGRKSVREQEILMRSHSELIAQRDIILARLNAPDLLRWGLTLGNLITTSAAFYAETAAWAKAIHNQFPDAHGLTWTSNRCDPAKAYLFFGDRVCATDFSIVSSRDGASDKSLLADVRSACQRAGILITR